MSTMDVGRPTYKMNLPHISTILHHALGLRWKNVPLVEFLGLIIIKPKIMIKIGFTGKIKV